MNTIEPVICIEMLYPGWDAADKILEVYRHGFKTTEFWDWRDKDLERIRQATRLHGLTVANFSGQRRGDFVDKSTHGIIVEEIQASLAAAEMLSVPVLMVLSNELGEDGHVLHPCADIPEKEKYAALVDGLGLVMEKVPPGMMIVLEPLNTVLDHKNCYLNDIHTARKVIRDVGSPGLKILCDLYHQGMAGDDLPGLLDTCLEDVGYIHIADFPGRHEPGTMRDDWPEVLRRIRNHGWRGFIGFEYSPSSGSPESLKRIKDLWDEAMK